MDIILSIINIFILLPIIIKIVMIASIIKTIGESLTMEGMTLKLDTSYICISFLAKIAAAIVLMSCIRINKGLCFEWSEYTQTIYTILEFFCHLSLLKFCIKRMAINTHVRTASILVYYGIMWVVISYVIFFIAQESLSDCHLSSNSAMYWIDDFFKFPLTPLLQKGITVLMVSLLATASIPYFSIAMMPNNFGFNSSNRLYFFVFSSIACSVLLRLTMSVAEVNTVRDSSLSALIFYIQSFIELLITISYKRDFVVNFGYMEEIK